MSQYIYQPPPPPPPPPQSRPPQTVYTNIPNPCLPLQVTPPWRKGRGAGSAGRGRGGGRQHDSSNRGGIRRFNGGRGQEGGPPHRGGYEQGGRGRVGGEHQDQNQRPQHHSGYRQRNQQFQPHPNNFSPHPNQLPPQPHFNPAFFPQIQQSPYPAAQPHGYPQQVLLRNPFLGPNSQPPAPQFFPQPAQNAQMSPQKQQYMSYAQEQAHATLPRAAIYQEQQQQPLPPLINYGNFAPPPVHSSYGHFQFPEPPGPPMRQKQKKEKPDMDEATWMRLNGGKLLGTNIRPPETPEEINAWIQERRKKWPTKAEAERRKQKKEEERIMNEMNPPKRSAPKTSKKHQSKHYKKRKRDSTPEGSDSSALSSSDENSSSDSDSDASPETTSSKANPALHHHNHHHNSKAMSHNNNKNSSNRKQQSLRNFNTLCKNLKVDGTCRRGDLCRYRHVNPTEPLKVERKTLYQRLLENDREKENVIVLRFCKYLYEKGHLQDC